MTGPLSPAGTRDNAAAEGRFPGSASPPATTLTVVLDPAGSAAARAVVAGHAVPGLVDLGSRRATALLALAAYAADLGDAFPVIAAGVLGRPVDHDTYVTLLDLADAAQSLVDLSGGAADPLALLDNWSSYGADAAAVEQAEATRDSALFKLLRPAHPRSSSTVDGAR